MLRCIMAKIELKTLDIGMSYLKGKKRMKWWTEIWKHNDIKRKKTGRRYVRQVIKTFMKSVWTHK